MVQQTDNASVELLESFEEAFGSDSTKDKEPEEKSEEETTDAGTEETDNSDGEKDSTVESESVEAILAKPEFAKEIQSRADKAAAAQLQGKTDALRRDVRAEVEQQVHDEQLTKYFSGLSQEELSEAIASDKNLAADYARLQLQSQSPDNSEEVSRAARVYSYSLQVSSLSKLMDDTELSAEVRATLDPKSFLDSAAADGGMAAWSTAVQDAVLTAKSDKSVEKEMEKKWEAYKQDHLAENELDRPTLKKGSKSNPVPELLEGSSSDLLEDAIKSPSKKK